MTARTLLLALLSALAALALASAACDEGGGDGDGDADSDSDSDGDGDCGELAGACCATEPACTAGLVCAARPGEDALCYEPCDPGLCDYGDREGYCVDGGSGSSVCAVADATSIYCEYGGCETEYGVTEGTLCVQDDETWETFCFEACDLEPSGCDESTHVCVALADGGGVCVPR